MELFKSELNTDGSNGHDPEELKKIIKDNWNLGVRVTFHKKSNDELRVMHVKLNGEKFAPKPDISPEMADRNDIRRMTNNLRGNMVVTEQLESGKYEVRTIPLTRIVCIETL